MLSQPVVGIPIIEPKNVPLPGQVIIGYEVVDTSKSILQKPNPKRMNATGWFSFIGLLVCCWPVAIVPCFTSCSYDTYQRPVYGSPGLIEKK